MTLIAKRPECPKCGALRGAADSCAVYDTFEPCPRNYLQLDCQDEWPEKEHSDGSSADYYVIPPDTTQLQDIIAYKDMNAQMGEIFRAVYRYGEVAHSDKVRDINKIIFYANAERDRLARYGGS